MLDIFVPPVGGATICMLPAVVTDGDVHVEMIVSGPLLLFTPSQMNAIESKATSARHSPLSCGLLPEPNPLFGSLFICCGALFLAPGFGSSSVGSTVQFALE